MRSARFLALVLLATAPLAGRAADAPHEDGVFCSNCHVGHKAPGAALTKESGNYLLCNSCHTTSDNFGFGNMVPGNQAIPGVSGLSHRWDALATNMGATPPSGASSDPEEAAMARRLDNGRLMCSTCHDQHDADHASTASGRGRQTVKTIDKLPAVPVSGTGTISLAGNVAAGAAAKRYLIDIAQAGSETTARFRLSNDNGASWFGCSAPTTYTYGVTWVDAATTGCVAGASVPLNDGPVDTPNVAVKFEAGTYELGDRFRFYVSYPFLRADVTASKMCLVCHKDRNMTTVNVQGGGTHAGTQQPIVPGTTVFHHPVGEPLATTPLDANGVPQTGAGDNNPVNDLQLGAGGIVSCVTCHRVHNATSNSLSQDVSRP